MKKKLLVTLSVLINISAIVSIESCLQASENPIIKNPLTIVKNFNTEIKGEIELPSSLSNSPSMIHDSSFTTKATIQEVAIGATVSLIYPPDYPDVSLKNITIGTGITDINGKFKINPDSSFAPQTNSVYILEATKRIGGVSNNIISLRTNIMWNGSGWDSITYPEILINAKTTSLSIISSLNSSSLPSKDTIKKMQVINGVSQVADINTSFTTYLINAIKGTVEQAITNNVDSVAAISLNNNQYIFQGNPIPIPTPTPVTNITITFQIKSTP